MPKPTPAEIYFDGQALILTFPENANSVSIPISRCGICTNDSNQPLPNQRGWHTILEILKSRYSSSHRAQRTISTPSSPTIYQIERALLNKTVLPSKSKTKATVNLSLEDLGL
jgi:hypothetical protein